MHVRSFWFFLLFTMFLAGCGYRQERITQVRRPPNVILILADDLGYGDLGCYGQQKISTPQLDRMAREGIRFTRHYSGSTVCAPSRSALMTGMHTGHTPIRGNREVQPEGQFPLPAGTFTLAGMMKEKGYVTGAFGKWGLGFPGSEGAPRKQGFDRFFGYNCQRYAHRYYPPYLWENDQQFPLEGNKGGRTVTYAPDLIQQQTLDFIRENRDTLFFVYVPMILPHAELIVPDDSLFQKYLGRFPEVPFRGGPGADYGPGMEVGMYCSQEMPHATYAAMIQRLDRYVGEIIKLVEELGLSGQTLVLFTSDNGPHREGGADPDFFNSSGGLRGIKRDLYEGGIRVPLIAYWPGTIVPGRVTGHISAFWDIFPTLADLTGYSLSNTDGISFLPELMGKEQQEHRMLYWEFHEQGGKQAILSEPWKAVRLSVGEDPSGPLELYNLVEDPAEMYNVADHYPDLVLELSRWMEEERVPSPLFHFGNPEEASQAVKN
jgi:arylsulfatase A